MNPPIRVIVSGNARCGSSLTMQMLHAAGLPCAGEWPAFEDERVFDLTDPEIFKGQAVKALDPQTFKLPFRCASKAIWLDRDPKQQARSIRKMNVDVAGLPPHDWRAYVPGLRRDRLPAIAALDRASLFGPLRIRFEALINVPHAAAGRIAKYLDIDPSLVPAMAACVRERRSNCLPTMGLEVELVEAAQS